MNEQRIEEDLLTRMAELYPDVDISGLSEQDALNKYLVATDNRKSEGSTASSRADVLAKEMMKITVKIIYRGEIELCQKCLSDTGLGPLLKEYDEQSEIVEQFFDEGEKDIYSVDEELRGVIEKPAIPLIETVREMKARLRKEGGFG